MKRIFSLAFVLALTGAVAPGPMLALVIGQVLAQGFGAALLVLAGHALVELVLVILLARGLGRWLAGHQVRAVLGLVGGAVLLWMGAGILADAGGAALATAAQSALPWLTLLGAGAGVSLSNPYFTGWWATVGTGQVAALQLKKRADYLVFFTAHELGDAAWYLFVAAVLVLGKGWLTDAVYRLLLGGCGAVILLLGGAFLFLAIRLWRTAPAATVPASPTMTAKIDTLLADRQSTRHSRSGL
ncbi:MAG: LysE family transporter [Lentisphaeria bacterium]